MKSLGEMIRSLRKARGMLLREVAGRLEIDPSLLSRIEHGEKHPTRAQVVQLAKILNTDENELMIAYLSDKVMYELQGEKLAIKAMQAAEKRIAYSAKTKKRKPKTNP